MSFINDIQGQNTQLYPIVTIEPPESDQWAVDGWIDTLENRVIKLSTNNTSLHHVHSLHNPVYPVNPFHFKPLLLNIPSIKESIDIESRKFKISNVSLDISNIEYEGKRFTDNLSDTSLINWKCSIQFVSPSANKFSTIFTVPGVDGIEQSFYEAYTSETDHDVYGNEEYRNQMTQMVYQGIIRRISHDDTKVRVELEDLTEQKAHKDLPQEDAYLGTGEEILDKYKNKPIPMVYGHVDRSPIVVDSSDGTYRMMADMNSIEGYETENTVFDHISNPLWISDGDKYYNVSKTIDKKFGYVITGVSLGYDYGNIDIGSTPQYTINEADKTITLKQTCLFRQDDGGTIQLYSVGKPSFSNLYELGHTDPFDVGVSHALSTVDDEELMGEDVVKEFFDSNYSTSTEFGYSRSEGFGSSTGISGTSGHARFKMTPYISIDSEDFSLVDIMVDGNILLPISGEYSTTQSIIDANLSHLLSFSYNSVRAITYEVGYTGTGSAFDGYGWLNHNNTANCSVDRLFKLIKGDREYSIDTMCDWSSSLGSIGSLYDSYAEINMNNYIYINIKELDSLSILDTKKPLSRNFYANVKGRINTFPDHPESFGGTWTSEFLLVNPIDIIYDLVRSELGNHAIDEVEYAEAKAQHFNWKFGFTVNKKINSKKLIEDIAKSTKCFPRFKNNGSFGFNIIKDTYTVTNIVDGVETGDYNTATLIKESEVISYSFKKTKPEQIYRNVTVSYNKDYVQDSYLKTTNIDGLSPYNLGADPYYGIEDSADAYLEFESNYIRHDETDNADQTADKLASFLSYQYKNEHLLFNLKLPLQYINLEIGDLVKFRELFNDVKAYGIDYRMMQQPNGQWYYPLFIVTSTTKNLDSVSIECMQLHNLVSAIYNANQWFSGQESAFQFGVDDPDGTFYFPDADFTIPPFSLPESETSLVIDSENPIIINIFDDNFDGSQGNVPFMYFTPPDAHVPTVGSVPYTLTWLTPPNDIPIQVMPGIQMMLFNNHDIHQFEYSYGIGNPIILYVQFQYITNQPPVLNLYPFDNAMTGEYSSTFRHILPIEYGTDYYEKYVYGGTIHTQIGYYAFDDEDGDLHNDVKFGNELAVSNGGTLVDNLPFFTHPDLSTAGAYPCIAAVYDSVGAISNLKIWLVEVQSQEVTLLGDANLDGIVDILDLVRMVNHILGNITLEPQMVANVDINQDGLVNVQDIITLVNQILEGGTA